MPDQLVNYAGGSVAGDVNPTNNSYAKRGADGSITHKIVNVNNVLNALGSVFLNGATISATATLNQTETVVKLNAVSAAFTVTLPAAAASTNQFFILIKSDTSGNLPTVQGNGAELIKSPSGGSANTYTQLSTAGSMAIFWCDGTVWWAAKLA